MPAANGAPPYALHKKSKSALQAHSTCAKMTGYAPRSMIPMTRIKKNRSLKRIHKVKTGSISKLKREAGGDRQNTKRLKGRKTLSVFEKFLLENPEAKQALVQHAVSSDKPAASAVKKDAEKKEVAQKQDGKKQDTRVKAKGDTATEQPEERTERSKTLLEQLDSKDFDNFY